MGKGNTAGLAGLLVIGGVFGLLAVLALNRAVMPALSASARITLRDFHGMVRQRPFLRCLVACVVYNIPFYFAVPYYQVFNLTVVNLRESVIALMGTGYSLVKILLLPALGRAADRWGPRRTVALVSPLYILFFFVFPFCQPDCQWPLLLAWAAVAVADAAWTIAMTQALYAVIPDTPGRPAYFAVWNLCTLLAGALGAVLAAPVLRAMKGCELNLGTLHLTSFHLFYVVCGAVLVPCVFVTRLFPGKSRQP
jgi:predicted MFS family arabinose efflux permease